MAIKSIVFFLHKAKWLSAKRLSALFMFVSILAFGLLSGCVSAETATGIFCTYNPATAAIEFSGGAGTSAAPWQIATDAELALMSERVNGSQHSSYGSDYYELIADVNLNCDGAPWSAYFGGVGFEPIGWSSTSQTAIASQTKRFTGKFDCASHTIYDLYVVNSNNTGNYLGLFGVIDAGAVITNCYIGGADVRGFRNIGGLVGYQAGGTVSGNSIDGGKSIITNYIYAVYSNAGILVGNVSGGDISNNTVVGFAETVVNAGGLAGVQTDGTIINNQVYDSVVAATTSNAGGLLGQQSGGDFHNNSVTNTLILGFTTTLNLDKLIGDKTGGTREAIIRKWV